MHIVPRFPVSYFYIKKTQNKPSDENNCSVVLLTGTQIIKNCQRDLTVSNEDAFWKVVQLQSSSCSTLHYGIGVGEKRCTEQEKKDERLRGLKMECMMPTEWKLLYVHFMAVHSNGIVRTRGKPKKMAEKRSILIKNLENSPTYGYGVKIFCSQKCVAK